MEISLSEASVREAGLVEPLCVEPQVPVAQVLRLMKDNHRGEVLVCRDGRLAGIFTERDAMRLLSAQEGMDEPVEGVMSRELVTVLAEDSIQTAVVRMSAGGHRRLPVVDGEGRPTGLVTTAGVVHWLVEQVPEAVYNLPPVSKPATHEREGP
jgi:CBS domain-containing protein